ncbi:hypothetical protein [Nonomuraea aurantiaca]|uniref:hypothetical protein n=1 Tax=Nonomuraea aurantiaca TaxID=2878562 RepID=UPI001CD9C3F9|nr:hypothetical protein [Nonomuraea aurantiaca]MCA2227889.1 hypothetical protein [Nonomuraea aurantiaca]
MATALLDADVPLTDVQELLGHAVPMPTHRYRRGSKMLDAHAAYRMMATLLAELA